MILDGECGAFNPVLLQCLRENLGGLKKICANSNGDLNEEIKKSRPMEYNHASYGNPQDASPSQPGYMKLLYRDALTNIYNHRYYEEHIQNAVNLRAIALIDINHLEQINVDYGRDAGNLVLRSAAQLLLSLVQKKDYLIRYGGDEFLIAFSNTARDTFETRLEKLKERLDGLTIDEYPQLHVTVHIGAAYSAENAERLFGMADDMLRQAKYTKKQVMVCFADENGNGMRNA